jgi:demethylmenaquinone methyltransferase/2-methoxy-6-polyprenyl-1,4-benzoquinol methylase
MLIPMTKVKDNLTDFGFAEVTPQEKTARVHAVFEEVADHYDLMNDVMSGGLHRIWKARFVRQVAPRAGEAIVDVAGGTGDIAQRLYRHARGGAPVTVVDINHAMLKNGVRRQWDAGILNNSMGGITWACGNAEALPLPDGCMDIYTIAFGLRNVTDKAAALREACRVLKPGGRFYCLEFSKVKLPLLQKAYDLYSFHLIPKMGQMVAGQAEAYRYLVESIRRFPDQATLEAMLTAAGFTAVRHQNMSAGVVAIHTGRKP